MDVSNSSNGVSLAGSPVPCLCSLRSSLQALFVTLAGFQTATLSLGRYF